MPVSIPTRSEILARILADFRVETGADPLRRSPERGLSVALMGQSRALYGVLEWMLRQLFVDSADDDIFWRWAKIYGIEQKAATIWQGTALADGEVGTPIPAGSVLTRPDGEEYTTLADATISEEGAAELELIASTIGVAAALEGGQELTFSTPIAGITPEVDVTSTTVAGADVESRQDAQVRVLFRLANPPSGGGPGDYKRWALEVAGVTRAWEFPLYDGANTVGVAFMRDNDEGDPIPDIGERGQVQTYLDSVAPITAIPQVLTLSALAVDIEIEDLVPNTAAVRNAIEDSLRDFFAREAEPGATLELSRIDAAISAAPGEISHKLIVPSVAPTATPLQIPTLGDIIYV